MKTGTPPLPALKSVKLPAQLRERIRYSHTSLRTEDTYVRRAHAFIHFHGLRHPPTLGGVEVEAFLS